MEQDALSQQEKNWPPSGERSGFKKRGQEKKHRDQGGSWAGVVQFATQGHQPEKQSKRAKALCSYQIPSQAKKNSPISLSVQSEPRRVCIVHEETSEEPRQTVHLRRGDSM